MFLRTAGIPYEDVFVALRQNKHKTSEYLDMNPFAKVPVLVDDVAGEKIVVKESCAIARFDLKCSQIFHLRKKFMY